MTESFDIESAQRKKDEIDALFDWFCRGGWGRLKTEGEIMPHFLISPRRNRPDLLFCLPKLDNDGDHEARRREAVRLFCLCQDAEIIAQFCEAWTAPAGPVRARDSDARREVALVELVADIGSERFVVCKYSMREILRAPAGTIADFGPEEAVGNPEDRPPVSWLQCVLPLKPVGRAQRRDAVRRLRKMPGMRVVNVAKPLDDPLADIERAAPRPRPPTTT
jgi:hypothetical protein